MEFSYRMVLRFHAFLEPPPCAYNPAPTTDITRPTAQPNSRSRLSSPHPHIHGQTWSATNRCGPGSLLVADTVFLRRPDSRSVSTVCRGFSIGGVGRRKKLKRRRIYISVAVASNRKEVRFRTLEELIWIVNFFFPFVYISSLPMYLEFGNTVPYLS